MFESQNNYKNLNNQPNYVLLNQIEFLTELLETVAEIANNDPRILDLGKIKFFKKIIIDQEKHQAINYMLRELDNNDLHPHDYLKLAIIFEKKNLNTEADITYNHLLKKFPYYTLSYINYAYYLQRFEEDYQQSVEILQKLLTVKKDSKHPLNINDRLKVYHSLIISYMNLNDIKNEKIYLEKAIELDPENATTLSLIAKNYDLCPKKKQKFYDQSMHSNVERFNYLHPLPHNFPPKVKIDSENKNNQLNLVDQSLNKNEITDQTHEFSKKRPKAKIKLANTSMKKPLFVIEEPKYQQIKNESITTKKNFSELPFFKVNKIPNEFNDYQKPINFSIINTITTENNSESKLKAITEMNQAPVEIIIESKNTDQKDPNKTREYLYSLSPKKCLFFAGYTAATLIAGLCVLNYKK